MSSSFITLHSGKRFYFDDIDRNNVDIEDIACSLSHLCRYNGQMGNIDDFFSVAEHSVNVSLMVEEELRNSDVFLPEETIRILALTGLLHDGAEGFIGDETSPLKKKNLFFKKIEEQVERVICKRFGLPFPYPPIIKEVDVKMFACEYPQIFPREGNIDPYDIITVIHDKVNLVDIRKEIPYPDLKLQMLLPRPAYELFMARFHELEGTKLPVRVFLGSYAAVTEAREDVKSKMGTLKEAVKLSNERMAVNES